MHLVVSSAPMPSSSSGTWSVPRGRGRGPGSPPRAPTLAPVRRRLAVEEHVRRCRAGRSAGCGRAGAPGSRGGCG